MLVLPDGVVGHKFEWKYLYPFTKDERIFKYM
jgi:hypothetical protein